MSRAIEQPVSALAGSDQHAQTRVPAATGIALCLLLALLQIGFAGYQLGGGNQPIQVAFLKHLADPALFAHDEMIRETLPLYPTYFFRALVPLLNISGIDPLYLMLQMLTSFLTFSAVYLLGRSIFKSHAAALAAAALLVAGHHRALASELLYTPWFTHTLAALPLALVALALAYHGGQANAAGESRRRDCMIWAFALAGILFNIHALTAAYVLGMLGLALFADVFELSRREWLVRTLLCALAAGILAAPTLLQMLQQHQSFDATWMNLMRVRSADHSFPSTWWAAGNPDIPRFGLIFALFVLSWSFTPRRRGADAARAMRITMLMTIAVGLLFLGGYVFSEIWPLPLMIRLQPFRASRLVLVIMLVHIGYGALEGIRAGWRGRVPGDAPLATGAAGIADDRPSDNVRWRSLRPASRIMELLAGALTLLSLGIPSLLPLLPLALVVVLAAALLSARLSITQSIVAAAALTLAFLANRQIQFPIPLLSAQLSLLPQQWSADSPVMLILLVAIASACLVAVLHKPLARAGLLAGTLLFGSWASWQLFNRELAADAAGPGAAFADVAQWAKARTSSDAVFLAPSNTAGFRMYADRSLVTDWRDGTQLYFSAAFAPEWFSRLSDLEPGLLLSSDGSRLVARGRSLATLDDQQLLTLADRYHADYILLPAPRAGAGVHPRSLQLAYAGAKYSVYLPRFTPLEAAVPPGIINPVEWTAMERFMATTVQENIEKYRKADLSVQIVDPEGRPVQDLPVTLEQTSHAFHFGCAFSFFKPNDTPPMGDEKAPPMTPHELALLPKIFNSSMPGFASKWMYIEPNEGERHYEEVDEYLDYCQKNHLAVEYHYLTGLLPAFLRRDPKKASAMLPEHSREIVARYHDKVDFWQVVNDGYLLHDTPAVFRELRASYPGIKLGMSDCVKFYTDRKDERGREMIMYKGFDGLMWLKSQGIQPDFFSIHGHQPVGLWADPRTMYEVFDRFAKEGVKLHVSEAHFRTSGEIIGPVRRGAWTPDLQADYVQRFLTICFSHPAMEMVDFWGLAPHGWGASSGLLDEKMNPRPALQRIDKLIHQTWHTHVEGRLPLDGILATRAFHGGYHLTVALPDGHEFAADFAVPEKPAAAVRFILDPAAGTLTPIPLPGTPPETQPTPITSPPTSAPAPPTSEPAPLSATRPTS